MRHDLQEPLRAINVFTELLTNHLRAHMDAESGRYEQHVKNGVRRLEQVIRDLLEFSQLIHVSPAVQGFVDLEAVFAAVSEKYPFEKDEVLEEVRRARITHDPLPVVMGNKDAMGQVFGHLISNAVKYRRPEEQSVIHISAARQEESWLISFSDNGIGFEPQYSEHIFGLFKRLHGIGYPGTGLGLAVCRHVIAQAGGRIWAESEPGKGSVFSFALPDAPPAFLT